MKLTPSSFFAPLPLILAACLAGCATSPPMPSVTYPVTYQINLANSQVAASGYGPQNLNVAATQQVTVEPGQTLYYQVNSPVAVTLSIYADDGAGNRTALGQLQGTSFTSSVLPSTAHLDFAFSVAQPNSSGTLQFTLSDRPIAPAVAQ
jgi:hypothetical protein